MMQRLFCILFFLSLNAWADSIHGKVVGVSDGDTITVLDAEQQQYKIRLFGIDAPEKTQAFGNVAKLRMSDLVFNKEVRVEVRKKDRYGRTIGRVWAFAEGCRADCPTTLDVGLEMLTQGLAWYYKQYLKDQSKEESEQYTFAEAVAQSKNVGLWSDVEPVPPWEYRQRKK